MICANSEATRLYHIEQERQEIEYNEALEGAEREYEEINFDDLKSLRDGLVFFEALSREWNNEERIDEIKAEIIETIEKLEEEEETFFLKVWKTELDRDMGEAFVCDSYTSSEDAIYYAKRLYHRDGYACVEVCVGREEDCVFHISDDTDYEGEVC